MIYKLLRKKALTVQVLLNALGEAAEHGELDGLAGEERGLPVKVEVHEGGGSVFPAEKGKIDTAKDQRS